MNKLIILVILIFTTNLYSQTKKSIFVDDKQDYVVFLEKNTKFTNKDIQTTEIDAFVKTTKDNFDYTVLVSKIFEHKYTAGNLIDSDYEKYFLNTCNCSILERELIFYNNLKTLRYKIKAINEDNVFIGYNDSFISNDILYNVLFLTFEENFDKQRKNYTDMMNTFIVNGKTTIDKYKEYDIVKD